MGALDLSIFSLASFLIFLVPVFYINRHLGLEINKTMITSIVRMCIQLSFVGVYLEFLFKFNSPVLNTVYLLIMIAIACQSILKSSNLKLRKFFIPVFFALLFPFTIMLFFFNAAVVRIDNLFEAKYMIPIGGMLLGNCLRSIIIVLNNFYSGIRRDEKVYLYSLSLLCSRIQALKPYFRQSFLAAVTPTMATMATIGLVSLPGMMTGQILGGSIPIVAIKYQIAIMFSIFYTGYFCVILSVLFSLKVGFNALDVLNQDIFVSKV
ncbi:ABC transporter permease [Desulfobacula toluolica]|uniref:Putative ABC transporter, permease protein n=1 Tax=Desulfobacula toluolica (strain DSM 7467 / Tol2) TaxID=651182 RepID=K0NTT2_DESTT|nr:ABC transporter permease [Desulfobacula toluolica]CCK82487.1 putative ABC transporter, permease protein [Desulfobacula toluolica Tol2]